MAIKQPPKPPGSITQPADHKNERIAEVSNVNRVVSEMQKKVDQQLSEAQVDIGEFEGIENVQNSMVKVLSSLNSTVGTIGYGFAKIAADTGRASTDAIKQYGKAISEDIGLNKRNIVATALAQSSPIFGYFAAKFVETDVFQAAKEKMKSNISAALGGITSKFREGFGNLISRAKYKGEKEKPIKGIRKPKEKVPHMQSGGYVQKGGAAMLHAAEVVVPIDKILSRIDETIGTTKELAAISKHAQLSSLAHMRTYVASAEKMEKVGMVKGFLRAMRQVHTQYTEPDTTRMLRALLGIQDAIGAQIGSWQQIWQKMLVEHPFFRKAAFALRGLGAVFSVPFKLTYSFFKTRGGYKSHVSRAKNPLKAIAENTGMLYAEGMWQLENIAQFTRATAEATRDLSGAITGKKYAPLEGVPRGEWSIFGLTRSLTNWATKALLKGGGTWLSAIQHREDQEKAGKKLDFDPYLEKVDRITNFWTKEREFIGTTILDKLFKRRKALKEIYGEGLPEKVQAEVKKQNAIPVSEIHMEGYIKKSDKFQKELFGYTSEIVETTADELKLIEKDERRKKRKGVFGFLGGGLGIIKTLLGGGLSAILPMITGFLVPWLTSIWTSLFPGGIVKILTGTLASTPMWTTIAAAASAALLGATIGKMLDKLIGISSGFQAAQTRIDQRASERDKEQTKVLNERAARARGGGEKGFLSAQEIAITAQLSKHSKERKEAAGWTGERKIFQIETAQRQFMEENMNEYLKYGPGQLEALRAKWIQEGGYNKSAFLKLGENYGRDREAAFLKYVQAKGKPLSAMEMAQAQAAYDYKYYDKFSATDRVGGVWKDTTDFAKEKAAEALVQTKAMEKGLREQAKKMLEGSKEIGAGIASSVSQATNQVTTSITNNSRIINQSAQKVRDMFSEYEHAVIKGDYMSEGF